MSVKRFSILALVVLLAAGSAVAQKIKSPGTDITVSKNSEDDAMYSTIQAAVNAAKPGNVIEILDAAVYEGQVTIDGRATSPWPGVTGGKNGITIRYVPPAGTSLTSNFARPTIRHRDIANTSPKNNVEAKVDSELPGGAGNFETNGALRIIRAEDVTIEGIAVDGVSAFPFGGTGVWCPNTGGNCSDMFHGSAAITLAVAVGATIRGCDIKNAYFGINVKDRNTGGVYGNPNPADNDKTVPLSSFGKTGYHLIEYNRIHANSVGVFFESAWDLGSTVRYNLIYSNRHTTATKNAITIEKDNQRAGAFLFKDIYLTPIAIYNNTLYDNSGNLWGNWRIGGQHLIFNNIFSKATLADEGGGDYMEISGKFPNNRMYNTVLSGNKKQSDNAVRVQCQKDQFNCTQNSAYAPGGCWVTTVGVQGFADLRGTATSLVNCQFTGQSQNQDIVRPGAVMTGYAATNVRWLQTEGGTHGSSGNTINLPTLFKSVTETSPDFLVPDWTHADVISFIKGQGWVNMSNPNGDGSVADLGAVPFGGRNPTVARIKPDYFVMISGGTRAEASIKLDLKSGDIKNAKIKSLRWISPLPDNSGNAVWGTEFVSVPATSFNALNNVTNTLNVGSNPSITFTVPNVANTTQYGFFELVAEGTDANGKTVVSDVGFLPYRRLEQRLNIDFFKATGGTADADKISTVRAGDTIRMRITAQESKGGTWTAFNNTLNDVVFALSSGIDSYIYCVGTNCPSSAAGGKPLVEDVNVGTAGIATKTYMIIFTKAGEEAVRGTAQWVENPGRENERRLPFPGIGNITVTPGDPAKVEFKIPIPSSQSGDNPPIINRGAPMDVLVEVQDKFGNAVNRAVPVSISVDNKNIGDVDENSVSTGTDGVAKFVARVTGGVRGDIFEMTATMTFGSVTASDKGKLKVGRTLAALQVFYSDAGPAANATPDNSVGINAMTTKWEPITVKATESGAVLNTRGGCVSVVSEPPGLVFSATAGGAEATTFPMTAGIATFFVNSKENYNGGVAVSMLDAACSTPDGGINVGDRGDIKFTKPEESILNAVVYCDGHGSPDSVIVRYASDGSSLFDGIAVPDSLRLTWGLGTNAVTRVTKEINRLDSFTVSASFRATAFKDAFPKGFTSINGNGAGLVMLYTNDKEDDFFDVLDGVGPIISDGGDLIAGRASPLIVENLNPDTQLDTLIIMLSETLRDEAALEGDGALVYTELADPPNDPATGGSALNVQTAYEASGGYRVILAASSSRPKAGNWIRFAGGNKEIKDMAGNPTSTPPHPDNGVHLNNRWVQLKIREVQPEIASAWYTSNSLTGRQDYVYVTFNKPVDLAWFTGGYFRFGNLSGDSSAVKGGASSFLSVLDDDPKTVRVRLGKGDADAWPRSQDTVTTVGNPTLTVGFNSAQSWDPVAAPLQDKAKPVLAQGAVLRIGADNDTPDTLEIIYSEEIADVATISTPVVVKLTGLGLEHTPNLEYVGISEVNKTTYWKVSYVVKSGLGEGSTFPTNGDSVFIYTQAGVKDKATDPNQQDDPNRKVPLTIMRGSINWKVTIKNNPLIKDGASGTSTVVLSPGVKGAAVRINFSVRLYDNVGNLVVDEKNLKENEDFDAVWTWSGYNYKGRMAGTGTYLFVAVCDAEIMGADKQSVEKKERKEVRRSIGFVR